MEMMILLMIIFLSPPFFLFWQQPFPVVQASSSSSFAISKENCEDRCGNVRVPYPFGIGREECAKNRSFFLNCDQFGTLFYRNIYIEIPVYNISLETSTYTTSLPPSYKCYNQAGFSFGNSNLLLWFESSPFTISPTRNKLTALGCDTLGLMTDSNSTIVGSGCVSLCDKTTATAVANLTSCSGFGCCQTPITENSKELHISVRSLRDHTDVWTFNPCSYVFVAENDFDISTYNLSVTINKNQTNLPPSTSMVLEWVTGDDIHNCQASEGPSGYSCSTNANCTYSKPGRGSICSCLPGFIGNPYLQQGCQDIDECSLEYRDQYPCHDGTCKNIIGSYTCQCPLGMSGDGKVGCRGFPLTTLIPAIGGVVIFVVIAYYCTMLLIRWYTKKRNKRRYFAENKGMLIKAQRFKIFSEAELEKATNNYDSSQFLGEGGFGSVYKGVLEDGMLLVAIKKPKGNDKVTITQEFQQEIAIVSQVNHRNVVKIVGLCLETRIPLLVYEFISNGTLYHYIHGRHRGSQVVLNSWRNRLRIASEIADALNYLHSLADPPIIHGDVKSMNILLDDHYTVKVADFGASVLITSQSQAEMGYKVQGTLGYLDPEYLMTGHLTEKSDVYSFAVVLVELLTGEKPASTTREGEKKNLIQYFISAVEDHRVIRVVDFEVLDDGGEMEQVEAMGELIKKCLNNDGIRRPTMREVAEEVGMLKRLNGNVFDDETENCYLLGQSSHSHTTSTFDEFSTASMDNSKLYTGQGSTASFSTAVESIRV